MIVCKFGGSSVADYNSLLRVKNILAENKQRNIIVVSAIGKSKKDDLKLTDLLELAIKHRTYVDYNQIFERIKTKMINFANDVGVNPHLILDFNLFNEQIKSLSVNIDYILSRGEYFSAKVLAEFLKEKFIDAKEVIKRDLNNRIALSFTKEYLRKVNPNKRYIIPGFYCSNANGEISLLGRGGGDVTGAIIAKCTDADLYENYSDVNGVLTIDNKLSTNAKTVKNLSIAQLLNCVKGGANVYCMGAIPYTSTKLAIKNTFDNRNEFTLVSRKSSFYFISSPKKYAVIRNTKKLSKSLFISDILNSFMKHKIEISEAIYSNDTLFFSLKENRRLIFVEGVTLTLYENYNLKLLRNLTRLSKRKKVAVKIIKLPLPFQKTKIFFLGNINQEFINEIIYNLENKNTP